MIIAEKNISNLKKVLTFEENSNILSDISCFIIRYLSKTSSKINHSKLSKNFIGKYVTNVSVEDYLETVYYNLDLEINTLILSLIYLDRVCRMNNLLINIENFHRLFFTSLVIAIKYSDDSANFNSFYTEIGGVSLKCFNQMEKEFLKSIKYKLYVNEVEFNLYAQNFIKV